LRDGKVSAPGWLNVALAAVMLAVAACCAVRLAIWLLRGRAAEPEADGLHLAMGVAMAGMLVPGLSAVRGTAWLAMFATAAVWFGWQAVRAPARRRLRPWQCAHPAPHAVESAAMVYMLWPSRIGGHQAMAMPGMTAHSVPNPALALVLALFMLGYILWNADQLATRALVRAGDTSSQPAAGAQAPGYGIADWALAPRLATCYKIVMSAAMGYMLLSML
jgi:hypothetical protein